MKRQPGGVRRKGVPMRTLISSLLLVALCALPLSAQEKEAERLKKAAVLIEEVVGTPEGISKDLLNKAVCVGIVPSFKKLALGIGGGGGKGAIICRRGGAGAWGGPAAVYTG